MLLRFVTLSNHVAIEVCYAFETTFPGGVGRLSGGATQIFGPQPRGSGSGAGVEVGVVGGADDHEGGDEDVSRDDDEGP
ncbi:hypothetical protein Tco_1339156 [Tanacetum coccineum]